MILAINTIVHVHIIVMYQQSLSIIVNLECIRACM